MFNVVLWQSDVVYGFLYWVGSLKLMLNCLSLAISQKCASSGLLKKYNNATNVTLYKAQ